MGLYSWSGKNSLIERPMQIALINTATARPIRNFPPNKDHVYDKAIRFTAGADIKKVKAGPTPAPCCMMLVKIGITPQEQTVRIPPDKAATG